MKLETLLFSFVAAMATPVVQAYDWQPLPSKAPEPADNPTTPEKIELGRLLYFDPRFSTTGTVSCNSCHNLMLGGEDNRAVSMGVHGKMGGRSAPTVWNSAFSSAQFWDGRAASLEDQAKGPVVNPVEMGMTLEEVKNFDKETLLDLLGVQLSMARVKCALLSLKVLKAGAYGIPEKGVMRREIDD